MVRIPVKYFDNDYFITKAGQKRLRVILKMFDAPLKELKNGGFDRHHYEWTDEIKDALNDIRDHYL
jgi:hypothetical protein